MSTMTMPTIKHSRTGNTPTDANTLKLKLTPNTNGWYPNIADSNFLSTVQNALAGGDATESFFDASNQTSDFWGWVAEHYNLGENVFASGTDSDGNEIVMISNGNVNMRMGVFLQDLEDAGVTALATTDDGTTITGLANMQTGNTTTLASRGTSLTMAVAGIPVGIILTKSLMKSLLKPIYQNMSKLVGRLASKIQEATAVEDPAIDALEEAGEVVQQSSLEVEEAGEGAVEAGIEFVTIEWGEAVLEIGGLSVLAAVPMIALALGHPMVNSIVVQNHTDLDFTWVIGYQNSGSISVQPGSDGTVTSTIPAMQQDVDMWGDTTDDPTVYEADFQFINSNDYGSIGYNMVLNPSGGGESANVVVAIPWAGTNTIWVGASSDDASQTYHNHSEPNNQTSVNATFDNGSYKVTAAINKLSGKTGNQYFYGILVVIEPVA